jgi:hypothetical protein
MSNDKKNKNQPLEATHIEETAIPEFILVDNSPVGTVLHTDSCSGMHGFVIMQGKAAKAFFFATSYTTGQFPPTFLTSYVNNTPIYSHEEAQAIIQAENELNIRLRQQRNDLHNRMAQEANAAKTDNALFEVLIQRIEAFEDPVEAARMLTLMFNTVIPQQQTTNFGIWRGMQQQQQPDTEIEQDNIKLRRERIFPVLLHLFTLPRVPEWTKNQAMEHFAELIPFMNESLLNSIITNEVLTQWAYCISQPDNIQADAVGFSYGNYYFGGKKGCFLHVIFSLALRSSFYVTRLDDIGIHKILLSFLFPVIDIIEEEIHHHPLLYQQVEPIRINKKFPRYDILACLVALSEYSRCRDEIVNALLNWLDMSLLVLTTQEEQENAFTVLMKDPWGHTTNVTSAGNKYGLYLLQHIVKKKLSVISMDNKSGWQMLKSVVKQNKAILLELVKTSDIIHCYVQCASKLKQFGLEYCKYIYDLEHQFGVDIKKILFEEIEINGQWKCWFDDGLVKWYEEQQQQTSLNGQQINDDAPKNDICCWSFSRLCWFASSSLSRHRLVRNLLLNYVNGKEMLLRIGIEIMKPSPTAKVVNNTNINYWNDLAEQQNKPVIRLMELLVNLLIQNDDEDMEWFNFITFQIENGLNLSTKDPTFGFSTNLLFDFIKTGCDVADSSTTTAIQQYNYILPRDDETGLINVPFSILKKKIVTALDLPRKLDIELTQVIERGKLDVDNFQRLCVELQYLYEFIPDVDQHVQVLKNKMIQWLKLGIPPIEQDPIAESIYALFGCHFGFFPGLQGRHDFINNSNQPFHVLLMYVKNGLQRNNSQSTNLKILSRVSCREALRIIITWIDTLTEVGNGTQSFIVMVKKKRPMNIEHVLYVLQESVELMIEFFTLLHENQPCLVKELETETETDYDGLVRVVLDNVKKVIEEIDNGIWEKIINGERMKVVFKLVWDDMEKIQNQRYEEMNARWAIVAEDECEGGGGEFA